MAAEMAELYWLALTRDVALREYAGHPLTKAASGDLRAIGLGELTRATLDHGNPVPRRDASGSPRAVRQPVLVAGYPLRIKED